MENIVLTIGGLFKSFGWSDLFFFIVTLVLILLLIYVIYLVKLDEEDLNKLQKTLNLQKEEEKPLSKIVDEIETNYKPQPIDLSDYEREMEDTAIISYEELVKRASNSIYYDDDYNSGLDDVLVQKVNNKESNTQELVDLPKAVMMKYESEEAFLRTLKILQKNLVR